MSADWNKAFNNNRKTVQIGDDEYNRLIGGEEPSFRRFTLQFPDKIEWDLNVVKVGDVVEILGCELVILKINEDGLEVELKEGQHVKSDKKIIKQI